MVRAQFWYRYGVADSTVSGVGLVAGILLSIGLSDSSVIECERELKRAGVMGLLKVGDVVHDLAAGDDGNTGRLIWDGNYLIVRAIAPPRMCRY